MELAVIPAEGVRASAFTEYVLRSSIPRDLLEAQEHMRALEAQIKILREERDAYEEAFAWAYIGDGLDDLAIEMERLRHPFAASHEINHATQVGVRVVVDKIRARAATTDKEGR